jgi:tRNA threonylcarbamoyladenosine biosynthesis protein TsaB
MHLCIDAADDHPGVAIADVGVVRASIAWETQRNHSVELLPNIDRLLGDCGITKEQLTAVFVDTGPGGYAALRVGVSIAKALAHALRISIAGIGRLELDAWNAARDRDSARAVAVHRAGRGELAWAAYAKDGTSWTEQSTPRLSQPGDVAAALHGGGLLAGEVDDALGAAAQARGAIVVAADTHRVFALAELGHQRLAAGRSDDALALVPVYLRAPAIGPQP